MRCTAQNYRRSHLKFRPERVVPVNLTGSSHFNQARIEWAIRLRYSPMPQLDMELLASQLNAFRIGELRVVGKTWEVMMERDGELAVNSDKRKADASGLEWQIVSDGSLDGDKHAAALQYFYENLTATKALDQDVTGGCDELIYQALSSLDYYYSAHEILLRVDNPAAKEVTAEFRHTPIWFLEARRGYLGYLQHIFDMYGQPCIAGEWLTAVNIGWMRQLSMAYAAKWFSFTDWLIFCRRYGSGFLEGITDASPDSKEWNEAAEALRELANEGVLLHNRNAEFKFLDQAAKNQLPFQPVVETIDRLYAKCYRGVDLATGSRGSHGAAGAGGGQQGSKNPVGSSVQKEESGIFLVRDAKWTTGVFNERIDRPIIRYLFGEEPRAWFVLVPPLDDTTDSDLNAVKTLVPMGFRIMLKEVYKRFRFSPPEANEPCLEAPAAPAGPKLDDEGKPIPDASGVAPEPTRAARVLPEKKPEQDGKTAAAKTDEDTAIGAGARPNAFQTADQRMPNTQVDAAGFWSRAGLAPRGADGQTLPMPSLGYSLPNTVLVKMPNCRAVQALRKAAAADQHPEIALSNMNTDAVRTIAAAIHGAMSPVLKRLEAILEVKDPAMQKHLLDQMLADEPALAKAIGHNPAPARAIQQFLEEPFIKGLTAKKP